MYLADVRIVDRLKIFCASKQIVQDRSREAYRTSRVVRIDASTESEHLFRSSLRTDKLRRVHDARVLQNQISINRKVAPFTLKRIVGFR